MTRAIRKYSIACLALMLPLALFAAGQGGEFWQKKDYRQWTQAECQKLLESSPWAKTHNLAQVVIEPLQSPQSPAPTGVGSLPDPTHRPGYIGDSRPRTRAAA